MLEAGYIKLWRSLLKWEWYSDANVSRLFIHLLLTANYEDTTWRGETIHRGQRLTSVAKLAEETGLTTKEVRTALGKLTRTNELTIRTTNRYSVITIEKYGSFQSPDNGEGKQTGKQTADDQASKNSPIRIEMGEQRGEQKNTRNPCDISVSGLDAEEKGKQLGEQGASKRQATRQTTGQQRKKKEDKKAKKQENISSLSGDGVRACETAEDAVSNYLVNRHLDASVYFGVSDQELATVAAYTDAIFAKFTRRPPTDADRANVFRAIHLSEHDERTGMWAVTFPKDRVDLLMYAFEQAALAGKQGDWKYINGVLGRLAQRGISTLDQAEMYDLDRDDNKGAF